MTAELMMELIGDGADGMIVSVPPWERPRAFFKVPWGENIVLVYRYRGTREVKGVTVLSFTFFLRTTLKESGEIRNFEREKP